MSGSVQQYDTVTPGIQGSYCRDAAICASAGYFRSAAAYYSPIPCLKKPAVWQSSCATRLENRLCRKHVGVDANRSSGPVVYQAARPSVRSMKRACPNDVAFCEPADLAFPDDVHGFVSRNGVERPSTDRNHWLATTRFFTKR